MKIRVVFESDSEDQAKSMAELLLHLLSKSERQSGEEYGSDEHVERFASAFDDLGLVVFMD